jgi:hypothetical protein
MRPGRRWSRRDKVLFGTVLSVGVGLLVVAGGLLVSLATGNLQWPPLLFAAAVVVLGYAAFLWVRLTR